ncbi:M23 family metallopeptidase [Pseudokineococcus marinus]|uniref:Peptidoglycan DD-metalloendopeptidase family protein n=1 Tax=Pseudokineococcus marinus TaxID=351215 RepID=A0A849BVQ3_9ACTN|nr:M23 family metallopeptidase [Pseudokineococcus marinus]NNH21638.1 peptidoglycan DD-metalloendopeptidase family protein [Pseudokineococcus marinus]
MARTLGDAFVTVRPDTSVFPRELERDLRAIFSRASGRGVTDVEVGADTRQLPRQLQADVRAITARVSRGGGADVEVGADTRRLPRVLEGRVIEASRRVSRSGAGDVEVGVDGARLPRELQTRVEDAARRVERSGASEVEVRPDTRRFDREVPERIGRTMRRAAGVAAAAFGALQVGSFFKDAVAQASDLDESMNVVSLTFREATPELDTFFKTSAQSIGLTEAAARQAASNIGGLLNNMGYTRSESAQTSKAVLTLGADLGSAFNKDPAQAVEAIGAALRGETEPIRAFNVTIDDARVKAKALEMGMYSGKGALDANAKAQATLALITQQTADVQGDFANTSTGLANAQRIAAAGWGNLTGVIGKGLLPAQTTLVNQVNTAVLPALTALAEEKAPAVGAALGDAAEQVGAFIVGLDRRGPIDGFTGRANTAGLGVRALFDAMRDGDVTSDGFVGDMERAGVKIGEVIDVVKDAGDQVQRAATVARAAFAGEDVTTVGWLGRVGDAAYAARDAVDAIAAFDWSSLGAAIKGAAGDGDELGPALSSIATSAGELLPFVVELIREVPSLSDVLSVAAPVLGFFADHVDTLIELMPLLVAGFVAVKVAQAAGNVAMAAAVPLRVAEILSNQRHTAALAANTVAINASSAATKGATASEVASTVAKNGGVVASTKQVAATVAARVAQVASTVATGAMTAAQWALNAAMTANPIGLVIAALALLVGGLVFAYKNSETFRNIVDGALRAVADAGRWMWENVLQPVFQALVAAVIDGWLRFQEFRDRLSAVWEVVKIAFREGARAAVGSFLDLVEKVIRGAADAFGWVPGIGPKLQTAADEFSKFKDKVNAQLSGIQDRDVNIRAQLDAGAKYLAASRGVSASEAQALARKMLASGGAVRGPGTETSDSIPAMLSNNEHVWSAKEVSAAGGHAAVEAMRRGVLRRRDGGPVVNGRESAARFGRAYDAATDVMFEDGSWRPRTAGGTAAGAAAAAAARAELARRQGSSSSPGRTGRGVHVTSTTPPTGAIDDLVGTLNASSLRLVQEGAAAVSTMTGAVNKAAAAAAVATSNGTGPLPPTAGPWMRPMRGGRVTSEFGMRFHPIRRVMRLHNGIDLAGGANGGQVYAMQAGRVLSAGPSGSYGNFVQIAHAGGYVTGYAHLRAIQARAGQVIARGGLVGLEGATGGVTGKHLHQNVKLNGSFINPRRLGVYDDGGVATGRGYLPKLTPRPERVLSPRQTDTYDRSLPVLERLVELVEQRGQLTGAGEQQIGGLYVSGDVVIRSDEDLRELQRSQRDALAAAGLLS